MSTKLSELELGKTAVIQRVEGERPLRIRLMEMGLLPGTEVVVRRRAPLGDPLELRLRGYSLSLRAADAAKIEVEHRPDTPAPAPRRVQKRAS